MKKSKNTVIAIVGALVAAALCVAVIAACMTIFPRHQQADGTDTTSSQTMHRDSVPDAASPKDTNPGTDTNNGDNTKDSSDTKDDGNQSNEAKPDGQSTTDTNTSDTKNSDNGDDTSSDTSSTDKKNTTDTNTGDTNSSGVNKVRLNVPTRVQETSYWCGPASMQMVLNYKGISVSQVSLAQQLNTSSVTGTEYVDMQRVANRYLFGKDVVGANDPGYHIQTLNRYDTNPQITTDFVRRMKLDISTNDPLFVAVDVHSLYPELGVANHMVVVSGYATRSGSDEVTSVYFQDPSYLVQDATHGGLKVAPLSEFVSAIVNNDEPAYIY